MNLSIIIVNYNVKYFLEQCLLSIAESEIDFDIEIFVVDNDSTDGSVDYLKSKFPHIHFIVNKKNEGFAKANNRAIIESAGKYILLLNPDTILGENVLAEVCHFMDKHEDAGGIGVKMIDGSGQFLAESKRGFPTPWASFSKVFGLSKLFPKARFWGEYDLSHLDKDKLHQVDVLAGAFMLIRKDAFDKVGLLDEAFFMYGEDIDLSYRITKAGYKNYYLPQTILHYKGESNKNDKRYIEAFYEAMHIFFKKHYAHSNSFFASLIASGIALRANIARLELLCKRKKKHEKIILLDHGFLSYGEIIRQMSESPSIQYHIYSPKSGMIIGSHFTQQKDIQCI